MIFRNSNILVLDRQVPDKNLSPHFKVSELRCRCCGRLKIDLTLIQTLEKLRSKIGTPLSISSGYRCKKHNQRIGGVKNSGHTLGVAVDIYTPKELTTKVFGKLIWEFREQIGIKRVGCYDGYQKKYGFCHAGIRKKWLEVRDGKPVFAPARWGNW